MEKDQNNDGPKKKVMIIDDDQFLLNMYQIKFKDTGFDVVLAPDGNSALKKLKDGYKPDVILIDLVMPDMDGMEILSHIKTENLAPQAKLVVLSNQSQETDIEKAKNIGIDGYIVKAATIPTEVVEEVQKILSA